MSALYLVKFSLVAATTLSEFIITGDFSIHLVVEVRRYEVSSTYEHLTHLKQIFSIRNGA